MTEEDIVKKALGKQTRGFSLKIPFITIERLIEDIKTMYPSTNELFIYNADQRDSDHGPSLTIRNLRGLKAVITTTKGYGYDTTRIEAKWRVVFCAVEKGTAYVKVGNLSVGEAT